MKTSAHTSIINHSQTSPFKIYRKSDNTIPFWDDPTCYGGIERPKNFEPITDVIEVNSMFYRGKYREEDLLILSVLRDAFAISEEQLRRLLKPYMNSSTISHRLRYMAVHGVVDKWKLRSRDNELYKPSAVWSIGLGAFYYLKYQSHEFVLHPKVLIDRGIKGIQRYVAINEIRTQLYEYQSLRGWRWHAVIEGNPTVGKPLGVATMQGTNGQVNICFERLQQSQRFVQHFSSRIMNWERIYLDNNNFLQVMDMPKLHTIIAVSVATYEMVEKIMEKVPLEKIRLPIWFVIDEFLETKGFPHSIVTMQQGKMTSLPLSFMQKREDA